MMTAEQLLDAMKLLPEGELKQLKDRLEELLQNKPSQNTKRGDRIRSLAGAANVGRVLDPLPSRESLYEEALE